jgi:glycosyltransferase involved in cell wall biosynthesis
MAGCRALAGEMENETVFFPGRIETKQVESIVNVFDIGVLATFTEGISNSVMEYMMLGKPVIATDCDGTRELVIHQDTGFLVPRSDAEALAARIGQLLDDPLLGAEMGARGRTRIEREFSLQRMTDEFCGLFRSLGPGPRRKRSRPASTMVSPC